MTETDLDKNVIDIYWDVADAVDVVDTWLKRRAALREAAGLTGFADTNRQLHLVFLQLALKNLRYDDESEREQETMAAWQLELDSLLADANTVDNSDVPFSLAFFFFILFLTGLLICLTGMTLVILMLLPILLLLGIGHKS